MEEQNKQNYFYLIIPLLALTVIFGSVVLFVYPQNKKQVSAPLSETGQVQLTGELKAQLNFLPEKINLEKGQKVSVDLNLDFSEAVRLDGADVILSFDPTLVQVSEVVPGKLFSFTSQRKNELAKGRVSITFLEEKGGGVMIKKGRNKILSLNLLAKTAGIGRIEVITAEKGATTVITESGTSRKIEFSSLPLEVSIE